MTPTDFPESNTTFTKPEGWTDEQCQPLPTCKTIDDAGHDVMVSKWQLSEEEIQQIIENKSIYLIVCSSNQPPVSLHAVSPFIAVGEVKKTVEYIQKSENGKD